MMPIMIHAGTKHGVNKCMEFGFCLNHDCYLNEIMLVHLFVTKHTKALEKIVNFLCMSVKKEMPILHYEWKKSNVCFESD